MLSVVFAKKKLGPKVICTINEEDICRNNNDRDRSEICRQT